MAWLPSCGCGSRGSRCDDGIFCNGREAFVDSHCIAGTPPSCDDEVACTVDRCDPAADSCVNTPDDTFCQDGAFCNGAEVCDITLGCLSGTPVDCDDSVGCVRDSCDETAYDCRSIPDDALCDDGVGCTADACDEAARACTNLPYDSLCADDLFCTANERCDPAAGGCTWDPVDCDDSIACTLDSCDETADACSNVPDDAACEAGGICSLGLCDPDAGCLQITAPDGTSCDEVDPALICVDGACVSRRCGDGYTEPLDSGFPAEECDDGDGDDLDGCTTLCRSLDFQVNMTEAGTQEVPVAAVLEDGSFVIVFEDVTSTYPSRTDVRLRRYDRRGAPAEASDAILTSTSDAFQIEPALTALPGGGFAAAWADNSAGGPGLYDIKFRIFDASGAPSVEVTASGSPSRYRTEPIINYFPASGVLMVAWDDFTTYEGQPMMRRFDLAGAAVDADEREITMGPLALRSRPIAAEMPDGSFIVVWIGSEDGVTTKLFARLYDVTASPVSDMVEIPSPDCLRNYSARIALIGEAGLQSLLVAWERICSGSPDSQVAATLLDPSTLEPASDPVTVSTGPGRCFSPVMLAGHLLAAPPGDADPPSERWIAAFVWVGRNDPARDTDGPYDIYGRRFALEAGTLVPFDADPLLLTTTLRFEQSEPAGAINAAGNLVIAWTDWSRTGTDRSSTSIRGRYLPNGWILLE